MPLARSVARVATSLVATSLVVSLGCTNSFEPDAGSPVDAGMDAGHDAGHDAGRDAGVDAGPRDAASPGDDAGPIDGGPMDPGWVRLPGLPDECPIERATYPERLWDTTWEPCVDGSGAVVEECSVGRGRLTHITDAWQDGQTWLYMLGGDALGTGRIVGLAPLEGPLVAAWREPQRILGDDIYCAVTALAVGGGRAAFIAQFSDSSDMSRSRAWLYVATPSSIGTATEPVHEFPAGFVARDRSIHDLWVSDVLVAIQSSPDGSLYTYRDGEWAILTGLGTVPGLPQNVALVGDNLLWEAWVGLDDVRLVHARWGEPAAVWRDISPGDTKGFGTDGVDLAWFENHDRQPDGTYGRVELWTAGYRRDIESAVPALVRTVEGQRSNGPAVGGGWVARFVRGPPPTWVARVEVFSLRDGTRRTFISPSGVVTDEPFSATDRAIMFKGGGGLIYRFDPTALPVDP